MKRASVLGSIKKFIELLYTGRSQRAIKFRYGLIVFDIITILFFLITSTEKLNVYLTAINIIIGILIAIDFGARLWISKNHWLMLRKIYSIADIVVLASLLAAPLLGHDFALLVVLRGLRLIHSYHLVRDLRRESSFFREKEDAIYACVNLFVFIFVTTSLVFVLRAGEDGSVKNYIDALYFTVATLTTTGFGDITMTTSAGKLLSVFIMVFGVALFVRLAQAIFQPSRVKFQCKSCGLNRHDSDAVHCKHCGEVLNIEKDGLE